MEDSEPRQIGSYEVLAKLADGGVGTVYLARRRGPADFRRLVAIKRLHPQFASDPGLVTMFTDEARLAARIHHANVVSIVELGADADGYYVVMEYVEGSNLGHFHWHATRDGRKMPRAVALRIVLDALSGLHAAHEIEDDDAAIVNLVHRDVSPQNILLGIDGLARLGDFGIARATALREFETRGPTIKGKLEYMAPEQIECKPVDRTTDLFAMGVVLWELLTSCRLFPAANQVTTIQRVCFDAIPSPRSVDPSVSLDLERVCLHALERPRAKRYPTAAAFAEDLERAARADVGIATQREVAACMSAVLPSDMPGGRGAQREIGRKPAAGAVPDLAGAVRGSSPTHQMPASDPMVKLPASAAAARQRLETNEHPPVSGELTNTEPYGAVPPRGAGLDPGESGATAHYEEGVPLEVINEARLASRSAGRGIDSDPTIVQPERSEQVLAPAAPARVSAPELHPAVPVPTGQVPPQQYGRAPLPMARPPAAASGVGGGLAAIAIAIFVAVGLAGIGIIRLAQSRASTRAIASATAASSSAAPNAEHDPGLIAAPAATDPAPDDTLTFDEEGNAASPADAAADATAADATTDR